jgi:hypothetical protein
MGFSNPPLLNNVDTIRVQNVPNIANTQLSCRDEVLAAHPGVTLNATNDTIGGSEEDMQISHLASKNSYLTSTYWKALGTGSESGAILFEGHVHPQISPLLTRTGSAGLSYDQVVPIPMDWLSQVFKLWRGDIIFTFEIITTKFQRGRLRVSFDPLGTFDSNDTFGRVITKVLDIAEETKFEFVVPYMATSAWLSTLSTQYTWEDHAAGDTKQQIIPSALDASGESLYKYSEHCMNGKIRLTVLNTLTNDLDAVVVVHVRASDNFKLAVPCGLSDSISLQDQYFLQSGELEVDNYTGEELKTIRDLCHRSTACGFFRPAISALQAFEFPVSGIPRGIGYSSGDTEFKHAEGLITLRGIGSAAPVTFYTWFSSAFAGARASHRVSMSGVGSTFPYSNTQASVITVDRGISKMLDDSTTPASAQHRKLKHKLARIIKSSIPGSSFYMNSVVFNGEMGYQDSSSVLAQSGGSVHVPYQSRSRFMPTASWYDFYRRVLGRYSGFFLGEPIDSGFYPEVCQLERFYVPTDTIKVQSNCDVRNGGAVLFFTSAGSDISFSMFCNAPTFFRSRRSNVWSSGSFGDLDADVQTVMIDIISSDGFSPI